MARAETTSNSLRTRIMNGFPWVVGHRGAGARRIGRPGAVTTVAQVETIWSRVEGVKKISDRVIGIGPVGFGMDAILTWVPVVGTAYTFGAGGWLVYQAWRVRASKRVMGRMVGYLVIDAVTGSVPVMGNMVDTFFPGHLMAARALQKHIQSTHWVEDDEARARETGDHGRHEAARRANKKLKRIVYLGRAFDPAS